MKPALRWTVILILLVFGMPVMPQPQKQEVIPFRFGGPFQVMLIQGEVNGNRTSLIVDTGSNHTIISSKFVPVSALNLRAVEPADGSGYVGRGTYANASLKVGQRAWRDPQIVAMDLRGISRSVGEEVGGLLGMDFLSEFHTVVVDLRQHKLILEP